MARASSSAAASAAGVWKKDSVKDVAESQGIVGLPDDVATVLAGDVEYRLWDVIEESIKFMQHGRRTKLKVEDVDHALRAKNLEPLWGFAATSHLPFKKTATATGTVYHVEDEEIDLTKIVKAELPSVPRDVSFTAHWLAIEGVQPLIKENPSPAELAKFAPRTSSSLSAPQIGTSAQGPANITPLVKHVLSRELQLYFTRFTDALSNTGPETTTMRDSALTSMANDPGLHQLVPYLISWGGEQIATHLDDLDVLQRALDLFHAMLENPTLFIDPYLHQLIPPILTCLLTSTLPLTSLTAPHLIPLAIRTSAASLLTLLLERHSLAYPSLRPRITKTLIRGLGGESRGLGGRWGAARGLSGLLREPEGGVDRVGGNKAVRDWVGGGLKPLGEMILAEEEVGDGERDEVVSEVLRALKSSLLPDASPATMDDSLPDTHEFEERYGLLFGPAIEKMWDDGGKEIWDAIPGNVDVEGMGMGMSVDDE